MKSIRFPDLPPLAPLLVFEAAAFYQSFTKAAAELSMSQPAVAHHIKNLESSMNIQLFYRQARGVTLTPQGQEYFGQIHKQLTELQLYSARLRDFSQQAVRIKTQHAIAQLWLQPKLNEYQQLDKELEFEITATSLIDKHPRDTDIAIGFFSEPPAAPGWTLLWNESLTAVKGSQYKQQEPVLYLDTHWQNDWDQWSGNPHNENLIKLSRKRRTSLYVLALQSVLDNQGIMIARESLLKTQLYRKQLLPIPDSVSVTFGAYYLFESPGSVENPAVNQFCQWLINVPEISYLK